MTPPIRAPRRDPGARAAYDAPAARAIDRRLLPALSLLGLAAALAADRAGAGAGAWWWLAAYGAVAALRFVLAHRDADAATPRGPAMLVVLDVALWAALVLLLPQPARFLDGPGGFTLAAAVLLSALRWGGTPALWTACMAAWAGVLLLALWRQQFLVNAFALGFAAWLMAVWVLGRRAVVAAAPRLTGVTTLPAPDPTRFGWQAAIHAMPTPVVVVRHGAVLEVNRPACEYLGRGESALIGRPLAEHLSTEPAGALDPAGHPTASSVAVRVLRPQIGADSAWDGRVRFMEPGRASSVVVLALTRAVVPTVDRARIDADARRLAEWVSGADGLPWSRDDDGRVSVPPPFVLAPPPAQVDVLAFPLIDLVPEAERAAVNALYRGCLRLGASFDERLTLLDPQGGRHDRRVLALARPLGRGAPPAVLGVIAPASPRQRPAAEAPADALARLPVLVWLVDAQGRVVHAQGADPRRWGLRAELRSRPHWSEAFEFAPPARAALHDALTRALAGTPVYDLLNQRTSRSGGTLQLRSHLVPYSGAPGAAPAVLVMDTVAGHAELDAVERLKRKKAQYKSLVEASASLIWACDRDLRITFASRRAAREIYGWQPRELIGAPLEVLLPEDLDQPAVTRAFAALTRCEPLRDLEAVHCARDGRRLVVSISAVPLVGPDGRFIGALGMNADLTVLKSRERRLTEALRIERTVLDSAGQAIAVIKQNLVRRCNEAFAARVGVPIEELARLPITATWVLPADWHDLCRAADEARLGDEAVVRELQLRLRARDGSTLVAWSQVTARTIAPGEYVLVIADIDHLKRREADARHEAQHDDLTGLPNRRLLAERAAAALATAAVRGMGCAVFVLDLDEFKEVNDRFGHQAGDAVLREIAARLLRTMRPQDTVARRGGDEFVVLVPDVAPGVEIERIAERVLASVSEPIVLANDHTVAVSASVGVAISPDHGAELEGLLRVADAAMYEAKVEGRNRYALAAARVRSSAPRATPVP